ncbi:tRNA methyltransferase complex GCD14 subunit [Neolentinus lepideus HHB14362 ss-1]|uniref:tRNA (adenine(58)-N(1))-methyltransferase catalytic subunit TRM61 n=1 Tax=Neolentinus lepideus HHB14362 ss-1 TaxID=1314782 RepID=A0A165MPJ8_9AGAM|nr:tRNA methyltransferase complex GCD14 subunit [Neolentinus lepideus HHB14362 ss-1]
MWSTERTIATGDLVIVWLTRDLVQPLYVSPGKEFNSKFGNYRHSDLIGLPYGSKVGSRNGRGFIHVLRPTPELWTMALPHRTQILYLADIAFITSWLDIKSGSRVIEAGTGSGSFTHSMARTVGPKGHLWSYEFHEARYTKARDEFERHGMGGIVTLTHRNVCKEGFTVEDTVDAVFLDLPAPWDTVEHAKKSLRKDRMTRICCFSPCMEQVLRTVSALNDAGFTDITMYETLIRPQDISVIPKLQSVAAVGERLKQAEKKREEKRQKQIAEASSRKRKRGEVDSEPSASNGAERKRAKTGSTGEPDRDSATVAEARQETADRQAEPFDADTGPTEDETVVVSKTFPEVRGHTSYLTFACLLPASLVTRASSPSEARAAPANAQVTETMQIIETANPHVPDAALTEDVEMVIPAESS